MPEITTSVETTEAPKTAAKVKKAKAAAKPSSNGHARTEVQESRVGFVKSLRKLGATKAGSARSITYLVEKLKMDRRQVYGLVNGLAGKAGSSPTCLVATGHVKVTESEEEGLSVYLTAKGQSSDFSESPFSR